MTATPSGRQRLAAAHAELTRQGAVIRPIDLRGLTEREIGALAEEAEQRLRALAEGREAGWSPA